MCFKFIHLGISLPWFLNSFIVKGHYNYLLKLKTSENKEHGSVRTKRLMFADANGSGSNSPWEGMNFPFPSPPCQYTVVTEGELGVRFQLATTVSCDVLFPASMFISLLCRQTLALEELLDIYQLLTEICQLKRFSMSSENHRLILLNMRAFSFFFSFHKLSRKTDYKQLDRSILKATRHLFAEDVMKFWQMNTLIHRLYNKSIWKAWLMLPKQ